MTIDYTEKRGFIRMRTDSPIRYKIAGTNNFQTAQCLDLSASGVLIGAAQSIKPGTRMDIEIKLKTSIVPPLSATVEVVRSQFMPEGDFQIGAAIISTL